MAYAGNVSVALWSAVCRLLSQSTSLDLNESFDDELSDLLTSAENSFRCNRDYEETGLKKKNELYVIKEEDENQEGYRARHNTVRTSFDEDSESKKSAEEYVLEENDVFDQDTTFEGFAMESKPATTNLSIIGEASFEIDKQRIFEVLAKVQVSNIQSDSRFSLSTMRRLKKLSMTLTVNCSTLVTLKTDHS